MRKQIILAGTAVLCAALVFAAGAKKTITVTAQTGALQTFGGFGIHKLGQEYPAAYRDSVNHIIIEDLKITHVRFFAGFMLDILPTDNPDWVLEDMILSSDPTFKNSDGTNRLNDYQEQNPDLFFLQGFGYDEIKDTAIVPIYAAACAKWIKRMRDDWNVPVKWTGMVNEPQDNQRVPPEIYTKVVLAFREKLDAEGLTDVKMYAIEASNVDNEAERYFDTLTRHQDVWDAIDGLQTKSYNMAANNYIKALSESSGKPYFIATGCNLIPGFNNEEGTRNDHYATDLAARVLNDFNHAAQYWAFYMPIEDYNTSESAHRLGWPIDPATPGIDTTQGMIKFGDDYAILLTLKYYYMKHLVNAFDVGCKFRYCLSDPPLPSADMVYTYGQKPAITSSVACNPDSSWTIGVTNLTGSVSDTAASPKFFYYDADTCDVTINVEELASQGTIDCAVTRSNVNQRIASSGTVTMTNGAVTITVGPKELVTLRTPPGIVANKAGVSRHAKAAGFTVSHVRSGLKVNGSENAAYQAELVGLNGRVLRKAAGKSIVIPINGLAPGAYIVRVRDAGNPKNSKEFAVTIHN